MWFKLQLECKEKNHKKIFINDWVICTVITRPEDDMLL